jgi:hypothetical protein
MALPNNPYSDVTNYFVPPPLIRVVREKDYNINKDPKYRKIVTKFFYRKVIKWMTDYKKFKHTKKNLKIIESNEGFDIIYQMLRKFVNENEVNWYDLEEELYEQVKDYLRFKLGKKI